MTRATRRPAKSRAGRRSLLLTVALTAASAGMLVVAVYVASLLLPLLEGGAREDPLFGPANRCLESLGHAPAGFAVSPDGKTVAAFHGPRLQVCGQTSLQRTLPSGATIHAAAFDGRGGLWLSVSERGSFGLRRVADAEGPVERVGELQPLALSGTDEGLLLLEPSGKLYELTASGQAQGYVELPGKPEGRTRLSVNADGTLASLLTSGGFFVLSLSPLRILRAEAPCAVEFLWWRQRPDRAVVSCAGGLSLELNARTGEAETASAARRVESEYLRGARRYVQACGNLPCVAPPP